jgi:hypothetical protein
MSKVDKIEDSKLWKDMYSLATFIFSDLDGLPKDEDFQLKFALKNSAHGISNYTASAVGSISPSEQLQHFSMARSALFSMKSAMKSAHSQYNHKIDPDIMLKIDRLVRDIDAEVTAASEALTSWNEKIYPSITKKDLESTKK